MAFKMKGSPMQRNYGISPVKSIIGDVVASVGSQLRGINKDVKKTTKKIFGKENIEARRNRQIEKNKGTEYEGMTNFERRQADRAAQRESGGKSKFQRDIIKKRADRRAEKATKAAEKTGHKGDDVLTKNIKDVTDLSTDQLRKLFPPPPVHTVRQKGEVSTEKTATSEWKQDRAKSKWLYKKNPDGSYTTKKGESGKEISVKKGHKSYDAIAGVFKKKSPAKIYDKKGKRRKNYKY